MLIYQHNHHLCNSSSSHLPGDDSDVPVPFQAGRVDLASHSGLRLPQPLHWRDRIYCECFKTVNTYLSDGEEFFFRVVLKDVSAQLCINRSLQVCTNSPAKSNSLSGGAEGVGKANSCQKNVKKDLLQVSFMTMITIMFRRSISWLQKSPDCPYRTWLLHARASGINC